MGIDFGKLDEMREAAGSPLAEAINIAPISISREESEMIESVKRSIAEANGLVAAAEGEARMRKLEHAKSLCAKAVAKLKQRDAHPDDIADAKQQIAEATRLAGLGKFEDYDN